MVGLRRRDVPLLARRRGSGHAVNRLLRSMNLDLGRLFQLTLQRHRGPCRTPVRKGRCQIADDDHHNHHDIQSARTGPVSNARRKDQFAQPSCRPEKADEQQSQTAHPRPPADRAHPHHRRGVLGVGGPLLPPGRALRGGPGPGVGRLPPRHQQFTFIFPHFHTSYTIIYLILLWYAIFCIFNKDSLL